MSFIEIIKNRRSIRAFTTEKPPTELVLQCLEAASFAPNLSNMQAWQYLVLTGDKLAEVRSIIEETFPTAFKDKESRPAPALGEKTRSALQKRKDAELERMLSNLKAKGADMAKLAAGNFNFHNAPLGIIFATYPCKDQNFLKSTVAAMENFLLAATSKGLGTCWMNAVSICQEPIKKALNLLPELILVDGVAVGYTDEDSPINHLPRERLPIKQVTEWL